MSDEHKPLSAAEIEKLRALDAKATPGPWAFSPYGDENKCGIGVVMDENDEPIAGLDDTEDGIVVESVAPEVEGHANAAIIAAMRNALPRLLAMLTPPADAAVREAMEYLEAELGDADSVDPEGNCVRVLRFKLRTLLSHIRAAQAPRLTGG